MFDHPELVAVNAKVRYDDRLDEARRYRLIKRATVGRSGPGDRPRLTVGQALASAFTWLVIEATVLGLVSFWRVKDLLQQLRGRLQVPVLGDYLFSESS